MKRFTLRSRKPSSWRNDPCGARKVGEHAVVGITTRGASNRHVLTAVSAVAKLVDRINAELAPSGRHEVEWHGPASEDDLTAIEGRLGCRLPAPFREFRRLTGGGGLRSLWVSTAAIKDVRGSVIGDTFGWREDFGLPQHLVVIQRDSDDNEPFCLDTSAFSANDCPVVLFYANARKSATERIAPGFAAWYAKYLSPYFKDGATTDE